MCVLTVETQPVQLIPTALAEPYMVRRSTNENTQYGLKRLENVELYEHIFLRVLGTFLRTYSKEHPSSVEETGILTNLSNMFIKLWN